MKSKSVDYVVAKAKPGYDSDEAVRAELVSVAPSNVVYIAKADTEGTLSSTLYGFCKDVTVFVIFKCNNELFGLVGMITTQELCIELLFNDCGQTKCTRN